MRERIIGLDGVAGAGKTITLAVIRKGAEAAGYRVEGFAPTSRAAQKLGEAGIETPDFTGTSGARPAGGHGRAAVVCGR